MAAWGDEPAGKEADGRTSMEAKGSEKRGAQGVGGERMEVRSARGGWECAVCGRSRRCENWLESNSVGGDWR